MALLRINVTVLGYNAGDKVDDLPKEWEERLLLAGYAETVNPEPVPEPVWEYDKDLEVADIDDLEVVKAPTKKK